MYETSVKDPALKIIIKEVICSVPVESMILTGSKARGKASETSDYDIVAVMKTPLVPLYLGRLKRISKKLTVRLGAKVEVNPLLTFRALRAKGNLFLLKLKEEGKLIYGKNYLSLINPGSPRDLAIDWYFSYLASSMKELILAYDPDRLNDDPLWAIKKIKKSLIEFADLVDGSIAEAIRSQAYKIPKETGKGVESWFMTCDTMINLFIHLVSSLLGDRCQTIEDYVRRLLKINKGKSSLKNLEYAALLLLSKHEPTRLGAVFSKVLVQDRLRAALILLLASAKPDRIDEHLALEAYHTLKDCFKVKYSKDSVRLWQNMKDTILSYWSHAHTVMGL